MFTIRIPDRGRGREVELGANPGEGCIPGSELQIIICFGMLSHRKACAAVRHASWIRPVLFLDLESMTLSTAS